jgi:hypothetical protein
MTNQQMKIIEAAIEDALKAEPHPFGEPYCTGLHARFLTRWLMEHRYPSFPQDVQDALVRDRVDDIIRERVELLGVGIRAVLAPGYHLTDSQQKNRDCPQTWDYPTAEQLDRIAPSWLVKIGVENPSDSFGDPPISGERFWCRVKKVTADGIVVKVEQADMLMADLHHVHHGDLLTVERRHIIDLRPAKE